MHDLWWGLGREVWLVNGARTGVKRWPVVIRKAMWWAGGSVPEWQAGTGNSLVFLWSDEVPADAWATKAEAIRALIAETEKRRSEIAGKLEATEALLRSLRGQLDAEQGKGGA